MRPFEQRPKSDPLPVLLRRIGILLALVLIAAVLREAWEVYGKQRESAADRQEAEHKLADLKSREALLRADIASLRTERGMEDALRREYGVGREGEGLIVIVEPERPNPAAQEPWPVELLRQALPWW